MATITLNVTTTQDQNDGSDYQGLSLRDAILIANADPSNEYIINLPAGTYDLTIKNVLLPPIDGSLDDATRFRSRLATGDLDITGNVTIIGADPANTIINAETLTEPLPPDPNNPFPEDEPSPTIGDRIFDVLSSTRSGKSSNGNLVLQNVTIENGTITGDNLDASFSDGTINGGAINIDFGASATFINSVIADSKSTAQGGGINNQGTLTLKQTTVQGNQSGDNGGGVYNTGTLIIRDSAIIRNFAEAGAEEIIEGGGGGVLNEAGGTLIMVNTTVSENISATGSDFQGLGDGGGGVLSRGITRIINSTIVNNSAQVGSGIYSETTTANTILYNTIVGNNEGSPDLDGFFDSRSAFNLVSNANGSILDASKGNIVGGATTQRIDLLIGPLQDNGGATLTHALLSGSLAIDAGDNSMVDFTLFFPDTPALDQRGLQRIAGEIIDIGAYEFGATAVTIIPTIDTNNLDNDDNSLIDPIVTEDNTTDPTDPIVTEDNTTDPTDTIVIEDNTTDNTDTENNGLIEPIVTEDNTTDNTDTEDNGLIEPIVTEDNTTDNTGTEDNGLIDPTIAENNIIDTADSQEDDSLLSSPIYRFQNTSVSGTYLYAGTEEAQSIRSNFPNFSDEGFAFNVSDVPADDLIAIYRFQNTSKPGTYLFAGKEERQSILRNNRNFVDEGVAFYVYGADANKGDDIYRFQSVNNSGTYLFVGEAEKNNILANFSSSFRLEGVAFEVG